MSTAAASRIRDALVATAEADAKAHGAGYLNDLIGALISTLALYIAAIPDERVIDGIIASVGKMLVEEIRKHRDSGAGPKVETIVLPSGKAN